MHDVTIVDTTIIANIADFQVENSLGLRVMLDVMDYYGPAIEKDKLTLEDF